MKIIYEWLKRGSHAFLRRIELFSQEDLAKKPEIPRDTAKFPAIPTEDGRRSRWMRITDEKEKRRHGKGH